MQSQRAWSPKEEDRREESCRSLKNCMVQLQTLLALWNQKKVKKVKKDEEEEEEEDGGIDLSFLSSFFSLELGARWVGCGL